MQKTILTVVVVLAVAIGGLLLYKSGSVMPQGMTGGQGRVVFSVTDAATALENIESVKITIAKTEVQSASKGWVSVSDKVQVFDLLALKNNSVLALLADAKIDAGNYNQLRLTVSKVEVTKAGKVNVAKLPSGELKIVGNLVVDADSTSTAVLDFMVDKSLHITGNGLFIFAPVVRLVTKSQTDVILDANGIVKVLGEGKIDEDTTVGMNEKGETGEDMEIDENAKIEIDGDIIKIGAKSETEVKTGLGPITVNLSSQNNSGISGKATITEVDGRAQVKIELTGATLNLPQPAHVHVGSCASIGAVKYSLNNVVSGKSTTVLNLSIADLKAGLPLAVNVHKSVAESGVYVACGDIKF